MIRKRMKLEHSLTPYTKINSKWITDLDVRYKTIKLLEVNLQENQDNLEYGNDFLGITLKAQYIKEIIDKLDFVKIKNFCSAKGNVKIMRRRATDWEKIYAKHTSDKRLLFKIHKELLKLNNKKKKTTQLKNEPKTLTDTSPKKIHR